jgi:hypothetical protein
MQGLMLGESAGLSKKGAKQNCAMNALKILAPLVHKELMLSEFS